jgi:hypothetical protein
MNGKSVESQLFSLPVNYPVVFSPTLAPEGPSMPWYMTPIRQQ